MKKIMGIILLVAVTTGCNNSAEKSKDSGADNEREVHYYIDSAAEAESSNTDPEGEQRKSDNMKDTLKVRFPDKKKN
jgi:hypothetical protein